MVGEAIPFYMEITNESRRKMADSKVALVQVGQRVLRPTHTDRFDTLTSGTIEWPTIVSQVRCVESVSISRPLVDFNIPEKVKVNHYVLNHQVPASFAD